MLAVVIGKVHGAVALLPRARPPMRREHVRFDGQSAGVSAAAEQPVARVVGRGEDGRRARRARRPRPPRRACPRVRGGRLGVRFSDAVR